MIAAYIRASLRQLSKAPGFASVVVLTLALGIGANTALFSVVNSVLLDPLPYPQPQQLVAVYGVAPQVAHGYVTYLNFLDWQREATSFASMAIYRHGDRLLTGNGEGEVVTGFMVSADFFRTLGVAPALGRDFDASEDRVGAAPVAMISGGLWRRRFGKSKTILGRTLDLDGVEYTVIGVTPANFGFYGESRDVYTLIGQWNDPNLRDRRVDVSSRVVGRLKPGVTQAQAQAEMDGIARTLAIQYPAANKGAGVALVSLKQDLVGDLQPYLLVLMAAVGFLLLIACVNVANLLLARTTGRSMEFAIRSALGAGQGRILRQLLTESVILAGIGGGLGLALAAGARRWVMALLPANLPRATDIHLDAHVLWFTLGISLLAGIVSGCAPSWRSSRHLELERVLRTGSGGSGRRGLPAVFVCLEIAMAVILLTGTGLMLRTLAAFGRVNPGYDPQHVITFDLALPAKPDTSSAETRARLRAFDAGVARLPGVVAESVTLGSRPMIHDSSLPFWIQGQPKPPTNNDMPQALFYLAEAGYAKAMGLTLQQGRFITDQDNEYAPPVMVIDDVFARRYFPGQDPIGKRVNFIGFDSVQAQIVGVVGHVKQWGLGADPSHAIEAEFFYPFMQLPERLMPLAAGGAAVVVRTQGDPEALIGPVRQLVARIDPRESVYAVETLNGLVATALAAQRSTMVLLGIFGGVALALAAVGIYAVIAYFVSRRTREIGIRAALGAGGGDLLRLVLSDALRMALWGVGVGLVCAIPMARLMAGMLYGVGTADAVTDAGVATLLVAVALLAAYLPSRRAMRLDPLAALRAE